MEVRTPCPAVSDDYFEGVQCIECGGPIEVEAANDAYCLECLIDLEGLTDRDYGNPPDEGGESG